MTSPHAKAASAWDRKTLTTPAGVSYSLSTQTEDLPQIQFPSTSSTGPSTSNTASIDHAKLPSLKVQRKQIDIAGWSITAAHGPIGNAVEMDGIADVLNIPPPEMVFPHNTLTIRHEHTDTTYTFDAVSALKSVYGVQASSKGKGKALHATAQEDSSALLKVSYAKEWGKNRSKGAGPTQTASRNYDWTYSCTWPGSFRQASSSGETQPSAASTEVLKHEFEPPTNAAIDRIPLERLGAGSEPILFFDEMVLFEDELGDNGTSILSLKVRVMPSCLLALQRFFLRVDKVVFRIFDTRLFIPFASGAFAWGKPETSCRIIRDLQGMQCSYEVIKNKLPPYKPHDLAPLTDQNWVAQAMTDVQTRPSQPQPNKSEALPDWEGSGSLVEKVDL